MNPHDFKIKNNSKFGLVGVAEDKVVVHKKPEKEILL